MKTLFRSLGLAVVATLTIGANGHWNMNVEAQDRSYAIGNPEAEATLKEFVSYTCPHCATFTTEGEAPLQIGHIGSGKVRLEVHSVIRNVVDLTATMLVQCGESSNFLRNHTIFMNKQGEWLEKARNTSAAQQAVWTGPNRMQGRQNMAKALGFYEIMKIRGYERPQIDRCLADQDRADTLIANTRADFAEYGIKGTPSFVLNDELLEGVHDWAALETSLNERLIPHTGIGF